MSLALLNALHITKHTGTKHNATVIFFHGSGSNGEDMREWVNIMVKNFAFPHIKIMYPTAPLQPYTASGGMMSHVWFDRKDISIHVNEQLESLSKIEKEVKNLIQKENESGIPSNRIVVGGFSMGGALAMYSGYKWDRNLAGVFAYSSFLNNNSIVYESLKSSPSETMPPLLQLHGNIDELVDLKWGQTTHQQLKSLGVKGEFHVLDRLGHSINKKGMNLVKNWIEKLLPDA